MHVFPSGDCLHEKNPLAECVCEILCCYILTCKCVFNNINNHCLCVSFFLITAFSSFCHEHKLFKGLFSNWQSRYSCVAHVNVYPLFSFFFFLFKSVCRLHQIHSWSHNVICRSHTCVLRDLKQLEWQYHAQYYMNWHSAMYMSLHFQGVRPHLQLMSQ